MYQISPSECRRLVRELRSVLQSSNQVLNDQLKTLATQYAEACLQVNDRLQRCQDYLSRGLRVEALHFSQTSPDVLDLVSTLDFPERSQWDQLSGMYGLRGAPQLQLPAAQALNQAYAQQEPLEKFLGEHRRQALARAPLDQRMQILRQLAKSDSHNPIWTEDLRKLEQVLFKQLAKDIETARQDGDQERLKSLLAELEQKVWVAPPPAELVQAAKTGLREVTSLKNHQRLEILVKKLLRAHQIRDLANARRLAAQVKQFQQAGPIHRGDQLLAQAQPAFDWLADEDRKAQRERQYQQALHDLAETAETDTSASALKEKMSRLQAFNRPIPRELEQAYQRRLQEIRQQTESRNRKIVLAAVAGFLLVSLILGLWGYWSHRRNLYYSFVGQVQRQLQDNNLATIKELFQEMEQDHPWMLHKFEMRELKAEYEQKVKENDLRQRDLLKALEELKKAPLDQDNPPSLKEAEDLIWEAGGREELEKIKRDRKNRFDEHVRQRNEDFRGKADALAEQLRKLGAHLNNPRLATMLGEMENDLDKLAADTKLIDKENIDRLPPLRKKINDLRQRAGMAAAEERALAQVEASFGDEGNDLGRFINMLENYVKTYPGGSREVDFRKSLRHKKTWLGLSSLAARARTWQAQPFPDAPDQAQKRQKECQDLVKEYPELPQAQALAIYTELLGNEVAKACEKLNGLVRDRQVDNVLALTTFDGKVFYVRADTSAAIKEGESSAVPLILDANGLKTEVRFIKVRKKQTSPQTHIAQEWKTLEPKAQQSVLQFEKNVIQLATTIVQNGKLDPVLQLILLRGVLEIGGKGSTTLGKALDAQLRYLANLTVNLSVPWPDPDDQGAKNARPLARRAIDDMPSLNKVLAEAKKLRQETFANLASTLYVPVGWLCRKDGKTMQCLLARKAEADAELLMVTTEGAVPQTRLVPIGRIAGGQALLEANNHPDLAQGQVVFVRREMKN